MGKWKFAEVRFTGKIQVIEKLSTLTYWARYQVVAEEELFLACLLVPLILMGVLEDHCSMTSLVAGEL